ncbi:hypothetical protein CHUAL_009380 [Chamberlinius hualienensis]
MAGTRMYGFREIIPNQTISPRCRELTVNTGAAQGTLQDIKRPEACGGYIYKHRHNDTGVTRNRFIYWRISNDVLDIAEESLDLDLTDNHVCLRFHDTPVLDGVGIFETRNEVLILVATVSSVHRIILPHPQKVTSPERKIVPSILAELNTSQIRDSSNCHVLNWSGAPGSFPHTSSCWLSLETGDAYFALANDAGNILLVQLPPPNTSGNVTVKDLKQTSVMQRVWTGIVPSIIRGNQTGDVALSLAFCPLGDSTVLLALCKDFKLRLWSLKDQAFFNGWDLSQYVDYPTDLTKYTGQRHCLKLAEGGRENEHLLGAFLYLMDQSVFIIFQLSNVLGEYRFRLLKAIYSHDLDLIDFSLTTTHLWSMWTNGDSQPLVKHCSVDNEMIDSTGWRTVTLENPIEKDFYLPEGLMDPREAYCQYIFHPGRFSLQTITKAINIYKRSSDTSYTGNVSAISVNALRKEVISAIEQEIQNRAVECELFDDQYVNLQQECWAKFYLACIQYHQVGSKLMGLFSDADSGITCLIKKNSVSLLRPRDVVELLVLSCDDDATMENVVPSDLLALHKCLQLISSQYPFELVHDFNHDLFHLTNPDVIAEEITDSILIRMGEDEEMPFLQKMRDIVKTIPDILTVVQTLLSALDLAQGAPQELVVDNLPSDASKRLLVNKLFGSSLGVSLLSRTVQQMAELKLAVCRDVLVFLVFLFRKDEQINYRVGSALKSMLLPQCVCLTQAYFLLNWACETVSVTSNHSMDADMRHLAILNLNDVFVKSRHLVTPSTIVELFIQTEGGNLARILLSNSDHVNGEGSLWNQGFSPTAVIIAQLIWPISANFMFAEFLMTHYQYLQLQEYVRLLRPWCTWNSSSRHFLRGHTHLIQGEPDKALEWFLSASNGALQETFIVEKVLQASESEPANLPYLYFLKVIHLFEQFRNVEHVLKLTEIAIKAAGEGNAYLSTFLTLKFKNELELGHNNEAFAALMSIPNQNSKRDCLKQFISVLCERQQLKALVEYSYMNLNDEVCEILESTARTVDLTRHNYYELLYSFHVFRGNYRRAGSVMYEHGMRLGLEVSGLKGLQKQAKCYLGALNCLKIVDPNYAWIVKPIPQSQTKAVMRRDELENQGMSPKRNNEGDELAISNRSSQLELVELDTIKKEYELVLARLKLIKREPDPALAVGSPFTAEDTVILLSKACLFDAAIRVCKLFKLPMQPIFESLATKCIHLMKSVSTDPSIAADAWEWLAENDLPRLHSADHISVVDHAWRLLQSYIEAQEEPGQITYHRCVVNRLFTLGSYCPYWLEASYKNRDVADLLRQFLKFDMLESAVKLMVNYIDAILGKGPEYFGLRKTLSADTGSVWLPYTSIDHLLLALTKASSKSPEAGMLLATLKSKLAFYFRQAELASQEIIQRTIVH